MVQDKLLVYAVHLLCLPPLYAQHAGEGMAVPHGRRPVVLQSDIRDLKGRRGKRMNASASCDILIRADLQVRTEDTLENYNGSTSM